MDARLLDVLHDAGHDHPLCIGNRVHVNLDGVFQEAVDQHGLTLGHDEGHAATPEQHTCVYRFDPTTGQCTVVTDAVDRPNGLCFSPDESLLYVVESGATPRRIRVFDVKSDVDGTRLANDRVFVTCADGESPDGFRCDVDGNLWAGWGGKDDKAGRDGVMVFAPDATPIGHIALPERCANLCFGGPARNRLFMAASQSVYALYVGVQGV